MNRSFDRQWAKEMMLEYIDEKIKEDMQALGWTNNIDDYEALKLQRNRVAKFLGLPLKSSYR